MSKFWAMTDEDLFIFHMLCCPDDPPSIDSISLEGMCRSNPSCAARSLTKKAFPCHRYIIGAYEVKTTDFLNARGIMAVWPQAVVEALLLNRMANRNEGRYFIPVFGGDFNDHLVLHTSPKGDDFELHAAQQSVRNTEARELAVRYMRHLLEQTKAAALASLSGDPQVPADLSC